MLDERRRAYLRAMGIDLWSVREPCATPAAEVAETGLLEDVLEVPPVDQRLTEELLSKSPEIADLDWSGLIERAEKCHACGLSRSRTHSVVGAGNRQADLMIIAGGPDAEEDRLGESFVGESGHLLGAMLAAIGLRREQVYLTNSVKCHSSAGSNPGDDEIAACRAYLDRQIELIQPQLILCMGENVLQGLLHEEGGLDQLHGKLFLYAPGAIRVLASYHPDYLLKHPAAKALAWKDLQIVHRILGAESTV